MVQIGAAVDVVRAGTLRFRNQFSLTSTDHMICAAGLSFCLEFDAGNVAQQEVDNALMT